MKLGVVGSRLRFWKPEFASNSSKAQAFVNKKLDAMHQRKKITEVVSGGEPTGADTFAENWANSRGIPTKIYKPDPRLIRERGFGIAAFTRNKDIAIRADKVVAFWGTEKGIPTKGTGNTLTIAKELGKNTSFFEVNIGSYPRRK